MGALLVAWTSCNHRQLLSTRAHGYRCTTAELDVLIRVAEHARQNLHCLLMVAMIVHVNFRAAATLEVRRGDLEIDVVGLGGGQLFPA